MNCLISIVGVILSGKENYQNYQEWFRKVKNTLIFNDMWDGICENENLEDKKDGETIEMDKSALVLPTNAKDLLHYGKARTRKLMP